MIFCNKLIKKISLVLIFSLISCIIFTSNVYAEDSGGAQTIDQMMSSADAFLGIGGDNPISTGALKTTSDYIYNTLLVIAVAVAVIVGTYLGIKFMIESAEDKAKIKEAMIPFLVGCFVIFGAFGIWKVVVNVGTAISGSAGSPETPEISETTQYDKISEASEYINSGKDLTAISNSQLLAWYGQLSRYAGNNEAKKEEYEKVKAELERRGGYEKVSQERDK